MEVAQDAVKCQVSVLATLNVQALLVLVITYVYII